MTRPNSPLTNEEILHELEVLASECKELYEGMSNRPNDAKHVNLRLRVLTLYSSLAMQLIRLADPNSPRVSALSIIERAKKTLAKLQAAASGAAPMTPRAPGTKNPVRNALCYCGSGLKWKRCHGALKEVTQPPPDAQQNVPPASPKCHPEHLAPVIPIRRL